METSTVWNAAWLDDSARQLHMLAWRGVEAQHIVSTLRLVDTPAEQHMLEDLLESSKPTLPAGARGKHYLLSTPFRYRPLHASRFRPPRASGQWYGAEDLFTACAEVAYWRHRFLMDSTGLETDMLLTEHTFFQASVAGRALDLTTEPWLRLRSMWTQTNDYSATQTLAAQAQARGLQWLRYESVREPGHQCAVVMDAASLSEPPGGLDASMQTWRCKATRESVLFTSGRVSYVWGF